MNGINIIKYILLLPPFHGNIQFTKKKYRQVSKLVDKLLQGWLLNCFRVTNRVTLHRLVTYQTDDKKPLVWRNHTKAKGWKKPGHIFHNFLTYFFNRKQYFSSNKKFFTKTVFHVNVRYKVHKTRFGFSSEDL